MKHLVVSALALAIAAPAFAGDLKRITPLSAATTHVATGGAVVSTQGSVLIGSLGTSSTASVGSVLVMGAAAAVQSTGHTK